jgi:hypothetical protein
MKNAMQAGYKNFENGLSSIVMQMELTAVKKVF